MAKALDKLVTVEDFEEALKFLLGEFTEVVQRIGSILNKADSTLKGTEIADLVRRLKDHGWTQSLLEAAKAVDDGRLHVELVVVNVPVSKVINLSKSDQARLIKGEKFPLKQIDGPPIEKSWNDMTSEEANQLLGPKGGHIHTPKEQKVAAAVKKQVDHTRYTEARYDRHEAKFTFSHGRKQGEITLGDMLNSLSDKDELDAADVAWQKKMSELRELTEV